jgi:hypothetical protein
MYVFLNQEPTVRTVVFLNPPVGSRVLLIEQTYLLVNYWQKHILL